LSKREPGDLFHQAEVPSAKRSPSGKRPEGFRQWEKEVPRIEREQKLGGAIGRLIEGLGYSERLSEQKAVELWPSVAGEGISAVSRAVGINDGVLTVRVRNSVWRNELVYLADEIRARLNGELGRELVKKIKFL